MDVLKNINIIFTIKTTQLKYYFYDYFDIFFLLKISTTTPNNNII